MYHATSRFLLVNTAPIWEKAMKAVSPFERFAHEIEALACVPSEAQAEATALIVRASSNRTPEEIRKRLSPSTRLILCTDEPEKLSETSLGALYDIWPSEPPEALAKYYVRRLYECIKKEKDAWLTQKYLDSAINISPDLIWFKEKNGAHLKVNDTFCRAVGKTHEDIQGRGHCYIWGLTEEQYEKGEFVCLETEEEVMRKGTTCVFDEHVIDASGMRLLQTYKSPLRDTDGTLMGTIGIARDVTKLKKYEADLLAASRSDDLTGLLNRRSFFDCIEENRADAHLTIARITLSYLKQLNDAYGLDEGDTALVAFAGFLRAVFPDALLCRFGGGEFLLARIGACSLDDAKEKFKTLLEKIGTYCEHDKNPIFLSANMGITTTDNPSQTIDALIRECDLALYFAQSLGDGQCAVFSEVVKDG